MTTIREGARVATIPLTRGGVVVAHALVDQDHFESLSRHRWMLDAKGYARRSARHEGKVVTVLMHREVMGCTPGDGVQVDHIEVSQTLDNRMSNLRRATNAENQQNRRIEHRGVRWVEEKGKWRATARLHGKHHHLGYFDTIEAADAAAKEWRAQHMPFSVEAMA